MRQLSLFDSPAKPVERRPVNVALVRKHMRSIVRLMRPASIMPWHPSEAEYQAEQFPIYAALLPPEEGAELMEQFNREWERLKAKT